MNSLKRQSPQNGERWISLHDKKLSRIELTHRGATDNSVVFCFDGGFDLIENGKIRTVPEGRIELIGCAPGELRLYIFRRRCTKKGAVLRGTPVSVEKLGKMLDGKKTAEIFLELYDANHLYWRAELLPHRSLFKRLAPELTVETMDFFPMLYSWGIQT